MIQALTEEGVPKSIRKPEDIRYLNGLPQLLEHAVVAGLKVYVVTNQPDIARGQTSEKDVENVHSKILKDHPAISAVLCCPHDDNAQCTCRKPMPGLLEEAAKRDNLDLADSVLIGDRWRDIEAGNAVGCHTIFIDYGYKETLVSQPNKVIDSLHEALIHLEALRKKGDLCD